MGLLFLVLGVVAFALWTRKVDHHLERMENAFHPRVDSEKVVDVTGWSKSEIVQILAKFDRMYNLSSDSFRIEGSDEHHQIGFPHDIEPRLYFFLINYLKYPNGFNLKGRNIGVVGRVKLDYSFGIPDSSLEGVDAIVYVPVNDRDYDVVYVRTKSGRNYRISFTDLIWRATDEPRLPEEVSTK